MRKIRLMIALLLVMMASEAYAYRPIEAKITINGVEFSYLTGAYTNPRIFLESDQLSAFLNGVVCASPEEIANTKVEFTQWFDNPSFTVVLMSVSYNDSNRDGEYYVATYKKTGGVIDAVLLSSTLDIRKLAASRYLFPKMGHYHVADNLANITLEEKTVTVERALRTTYGIDKENYTDAEYGQMIMTYSIDAQGKITHAKTEKIVKRTNKNVLDENTGELKITEHNDIATLGLGLALIEAYTKPASFSLTPGEYQKIETELKALEENQEIKDSEEAWEDLLKKKDMVEKWQKNLIYQNPQKWLSWYYKNKTASLEMLKRNIAVDDDFAKFIKDEVAKIKVKAQRLWWKKQIS